MATSNRCGQFTSAGGVATNNGPGKSPRLAPAWAIASSAASIAMFSQRAARQGGSAGMKSTVPAICVLKPSVGKRVILRMPDWPAVKRCQFSAVPAPREVTIPIPVTTMIGRPRSSTKEVILPL